MDCKKSNMKITVQPQGKFVCFRKKKYFCREFESGVNVDNYSKDEKNNMPFSYCYDGSQRNGARGDCERAFFDQHSQRIEL